VGAHTLQTCEKRDACDTAAPTSAGVTAVPVLEVAAEAVTVGYT